MRSESLTLVKRETNGKLLTASGLSPLLCRIYAARGINSPDDIDFSLNKLVSYEALPGIDDAVRLLERSLRDQLRILIVGDYDADGTTGTVVLYRSLKLFGFKSVDYIVPDRFRFGYGLSPEIVEVAHREKQPDLIITVDNGVSSVDGVAVARQLGIEVLITDHHLPAETLPDASVIVNPNLPDSDFPSKALAGVGVAFYLMVALRKHLHQQGLLDKPPRLDYLLDLVALGTVADLVPLDRNNRILVEQGLRRIRRQHGNCGIQMLLKVAKRDPRKAIASDLAFAVGPRLNAAGRLEDTAVGIACLLNDDEEQTFSLAQELDQINRRRREITEQMRQEALLVLENNGEAINPDSLCLYDPDWHEGIVGLVASQLKERFYRPAVAFAQAQETGLKGSARSITGVHIRDLFERIANRNPGLITAFGGHAMAAGLTIPLEKFQEFKELFAKEVHACLDKQILDHCLLSDGELGNGELSYQTAKTLQTAAPWGQGFPEPLFDGVFDVIDTRLLADRHLQLKLKSNGTVVRGIFFNIVNDDESTSKQYDLVMNANKIRAAYHLHTDEYNGRRAPMLNVRYIESV